ncbi:putative thiamine transport system substrate-binding protein [Devosia enhydra]|uniref:Putative thiamine transport system substrate-binding protein n=1 Tax=Devosia enhydra TaxID=665118 RepID=A0A1K2HXK2_9HYPH|nr:putative thiamine transport system substrate-binding protein [Devosia enhydra]
MRSVLAALCLLVATLAPVLASDHRGAEWEAMLAKARGQTVYLHAWGGAPEINAYLEWAGEQVFNRFGIRLEHVRISDAADSVARIQAEKAAGRTVGGAVDLIWINGENFAAMKRDGLLRADAWAETLPNRAFTDAEARPILLFDFTVLVEGQESPWGLAQFTLYHDSATLAEPPRSLEALASWIAANPGRFTYAAPPNFIGTTFLKQVLLGLVADPAILSKPVGDADFAAVSAPLWAWLDRVRPDLWRSGRVFATDTTHLRTLLSDGEIDIAMSFNPAEASAAIASGDLPGTVRSFVLDYGSLGNAHFLAIPFNANAAEAAMVVADFLLSPEAQARKADEAVWGDPTVLDYQSLNSEGQALFDSLSFGPATLPILERGEVLPEPHPSWTEALEQEWQRRYAAGG